MKEQIESIKQKALEKIAEAKDMQTLNEVRVEFLGKKGELTAVLKGMKDLTAEERPIIGALVNEVRDALEEKISTAEAELKEKELQAKLEKEKTHREARPAVAGGVCPGAGGSHWRNGTMDESAGRGAGSGGA